MHNVNVTKQYITHKPLLLNKKEKTLLT